MLSFCFVNRVASLYGADVVDGSTSHHFVERAMLSCPTGARHILFNCLALGHTRIISLFRVLCQCSAPQLEVLRAVARLAAGEASQQLVAMFTGSCALVLLHPGFAPRPKDQVKQRPG